MGKARTDWRAIKTRMDNQLEPILGREWTKRNFTEDLGPKLDELEDQNDLVRQAHEAVLQKDADRPRDDSARPKHNRALLALIDHTRALVAARAPIEAKVRTRLTNYHKKFLDALKLADAAAVARSTAVTATKKAFKDFFALLDLGTAHAEKLLAEEEVLAAAARASLERDGAEPGPSEADQLRAQKKESRGQAIREADEQMRLEREGNEEEVAEIEASLARLVAEFEGVPTTIYDPVAEQARLRVARMSLKGLKDYRRGIAARLAQLDAWLEAEPLLAEIAALRPRLPAETQRFATGPSDRQQRIDKAGHNVARLTQIRDELREAVAVRDAWRAARDHNRPEFDALQARLGSDDFRDALNEENARTEEGVLRAMDELRAAVAKKERADAARARIEVLLRGLKNAPTEVFDRGAHVARVRAASGSPDLLEAECEALEGYVADYARWKADEPRREEQVTEIGKELRRLVDTLKGAPPEVFNPVEFKTRLKEAGRIPTRLQALHTWLLGRIEAMEEARE